MANDVVQVRSRRRALALAFVGLALSGCESAAPSGAGRTGAGAASAVVGRLTATSADIRVERSGDPVGYAPGMPLRSGDRVRTGPATFATIDFADGNTVYMNHDTWVMVGSIRVFLGEIFTAIIRAGASWEAYTNDLSAAAEGTQFLLRTDPRDTTVTVIEGRVRCTPTSGGAWRPFTITANQQISGTVRSYAGPKPVDARGAALWVEEAARRLKRAPVLRQPQIR